MIRYGTVASTSRMIDVGWPPLVLCDHQSYSVPEKGTQIVNVTKDDHAVISLPVSSVSRVDL